MAQRTGLRRVISSGREIAGALTLAALLASSDPARADHEIERVEGPDWKLAFEDSGAIKMERTGGNSFAAVVTETAPNDCFRPGTLLYEFSGHEPEFTGSEYAAVVDEHDDCTGEFRRIPANFLLSWDSLRIHFSSIANDGHVLSWDKERVDTDGDGLFDDEERSGINVARNPGSFEPSFETEVDLRRMGADPNRKDLFVEVDSMAGHEMHPDAVSKVATAFADAPVSNPDGSRGISIHIDAGPDTLMDPRTGATWQELSEFDSLPHAQTYGTDDDPFGQFESTKEAFFDNCPPSGILCDSARSLAFRYMVTVHQLGVAEATGISLGAPAIDSINAFQCHDVRTECNYNFGDQAAAFMHEFGHNLGLHHGGPGDETNHEPNHFSVMNYNYSLGIPIRPGELYVDYSRWGPSEAPDLDETALDERQGVRAPRDIGTVIGCQRTHRFRAVFVNRAADFNCDGSERGTVATDINLDRRRGVLGTANEWNSLTLSPRFLTQGLFGRRQAIPTPPVIETPDYFETRPLLYGDPRKPELEVKESGKGKQLKLKFKARDNKDLDRLIVDLGRPVNEHVEQEPRKTKGPASFSARVPRGTKVGAVALDQAGNAKEKRFGAR